MEHDPVGDVTDEPKPTPELTEEQTRVLEIAKHSKGLAVGANWFFWIAGLSIVNSLIQMFEGQWSFVVGLGITQVIDAIGATISADAGEGLATAIKVVVFGLDVVVAAVFCLFGWLARSRRGWAFVVGGILYAFDGLLFVLVQDWLSIGFHAFALFGLFGGYGALKKLRQLEADIPGAPIEPAGF